MTSYIQGVWEKYQQDLTIDFGTGMITIHQKKVM